MIDKDKMIDLIVTTPIEKIEGPDDIWESHIDLDNDKTKTVISHSAHHHRKNLGVMKAPSKR